MDDSLKCFDPGELIIIGTLLTFLISDDMDAGDLNVLGNFIVAIGGLILTWAAQKQLLETPETTGSSSDTVTLENIKNQIKCLQEKCEKLESSSSTKDSPPNSKG
ncbi:hypothetical protein [Caproiciproducens sp.]|uniref:hypothetical protein n=1 Tax=Caproiciproducens sp. TaxID=1954376 RepID=UPI00289FEEAB|nr:hypothetical protein [Caproiciproducens sp.]